MNKPPAFQFYAKDWIADTARLSLEEEGAYIRLLSHQWATGPLANEECELASILGITLRRFRKLWVRLARYFPSLEPGMIANERLEHERAKQAAYREQKANAGRTSAQRRANDTPTDVEQEGQRNGNLSSASSSASAHRESTPVSRETWLTPFGAAWETTYGGTPKYAKLASHLRPLVDAHGAEQVLVHWREFLRATEAKYASASRFAETFGTWAPKRSSAMRYPTVDEADRRAGILP